MRESRDLRASVHENGPNKAQPSEDQLLARFRRYAIAVLLIVFVVYVAGGIFQLPYLRPDFRIDSTFVGIVLGTLAVLVGVEALNRIPGIGR